MVKRLPKEQTPEEQAAQCEARIKAARRARAGSSPPADVPDWIEPIPDTYENILRAIVTAPPEQVEERLRAEERQRGE